MDTPPPAPLLLLGTALLSALLVPLLRRPAAAVGLIDRPGGRKRHQGEIPLTGGLAMFGALAAGLVLLGDGSREVIVLCAAAGLLTLVGALDDVFDLPARQKLVAQLAAAGILVFGGDIRVDSLGAMFGAGEIELGWVAYPFTLLVIVGFINAVNMADGVDGLAGGIALAMVSGLVIVELLATGTTHPVNLLLAGAILGFLAHNFPYRASRVPNAFMGDAGALLLGTVIAWSALRLTTDTSGAAAPPVLIAAILATPVFDTLILMTRRMLKGRNPMDADRDHLHHVFQRAGFSKRATALVIVGVVGVTEAIAIGIWEASSWEAGVTLLLATVLALHILFVVRAWKFVRLFRLLSRRQASRREPHPGRTIPFTPRPRTPSAAQVDEYETHAPVLMRKVSGID